MGSGKQHKRLDLFRHADKHRSSSCNRPKTKVEVKHLRRVIKRKPRARRHGSEAFHETVTEKDLDIIREVVGSLDSQTNSASSEQEEVLVEVFDCFRCGAKIERDSERCPVCGVLYVFDLSDGKVDPEPPPDLDDTLMGGDVQKLVEDGTASCIHLDVSTGKLSYLSKDEEEPDFGLECHHCGAVTEFGTDRCPMCGKDFEDAGLRALLEGLKFDLECDTEMTCPACGEQVALVGGLCPGCHELIRPKESFSLDAGVLPILDAKNIIFVHLDALSGDLQFIQKLVKSNSVVHHIHLESVGADVFDYQGDWKSLQRI